VPTPALLAIALGLFVLLLVPARRLQAAGWPPRALGGYMLGMLLIGLSFAVLPISARVLVPILVVGYLAPFVTARNGLDRLRRRGRVSVAVERRPVKAVSGPARDVPAATPTSDRAAGAGRDADDVPGATAGPTAPSAGPTAASAGPAAAPTADGPDANGERDPRDRD